MDNRVFISSTFVDLKEYREEVIEAIRLFVSRTSSNASVHLLPTGETKTAEISMAYFVWTAIRLGPRERLPLNSCLHSILDTNDRKEKVRGFGPHFRLLLVKSESARCRRD